MAIYVDELRHYPGQKWKWCHMATDGNIEELHTFAEKIGLKRQWFQVHPVLSHYDLTPSKRALALRQGATEETSKTMILLCTKRDDLNYLRANR